MKRKSPFKKKEFKFKKKANTETDPPKKPSEQESEVDNLSDSTSLFLEQLESPALNLPLSDEQKGLCI